MKNEAVLSNDEKYTKFSFKGMDIRFKTSPRLDRYIKIQEWDRGYIVVTARYDGKDMEEYIDLVPILNNLYIDADEFLKDISNVRISYDQHNRNGR